MRSYFRFLCNNKLYTAIELVGLSISLAFVIITGSYIIDSVSYDNDIKDKDNIYICHTIGKASSYSVLSTSFDKHPQIIDYCQFTEHTDFKIWIGGDSLQTSVIGAGKNFFKFLPYKLTAGNEDNILQHPHYAAVSESFAKRMYPGENPIGKIINHESGTFIIQGVFKDIHKSVIVNSDIIANMDFLKPQPGNYFDYANLVKIKEDANLQQLADDIYNGCDDFIFKLKLIDKLNFTRFCDLDKNIGTSRPFHNLKDHKLQSTFIVFCTVLLVFSVLNYIFLTIAFSRFRLKEMATRMLLGTTREGIARRIISESAIFTTVSFLTGIVLAIALEDSASMALRTRIDILGNNLEILWGAAIIAITSLLSGIIPALSSSFINPVEIIKGAGRKRDKTFLGKVFILVQSSICIIIISAAVATYLQTRRMIESPLGYRTENLLILSGCEGKDIQNILGNLPCVKSISAISTSPVQGYSGRTEMRFGEETVRVDFFNCDTSAFRVFGFKTVENFNNASTVFITESLYNKATDLYKAQNISPERIQTLCCGIVEDFRFGNITSSYEGNNAIYIMPGKYAYRFVIETSHLDAATIETIHGRLNDASITEFKLETFREQIEESYRNERNTILIISIFGAVCILLTIMAIIAISSYYMQLKMHDTAIMKVFGSSWREILWGTIGGFVLPTIIAVPIAIPLAYIHIGNWLENYTVKIQNHPAIYILSAIFVLFVVFASVLSQAIRLMKTNPAEYLKKE